MTAPSLPMAKAGGTMATPEARKIAGRLSAQIEAVLSIAGQAGLRDCRIFTPSRITASCVLVEIDRMLERFVARPGIYSISEARQTRAGTVDGVEITVCTPLFLSYQRV